MQQLRILSSLLSCPNYTENSHSWKSNDCWFTQDIPHISCNCKVHYNAHKSPGPVSISYQVNPLSTPFQQHWFQHLTFHSPLDFPSGLFFFRFSNRSLLCVPHRFRACYMTWYLMFFGHLCYCAYKYHCLYHLHHYYHNYFHLPRHSSSQNIVIRFCKKIAYLVGWYAYFLNSLLWL